MDRFGKSQLTFRLHSFGKINSHVQLYSYGLIQKIVESP